jgi:polysaccharide biosynthesis/export protein
MVTKAIFILVPVGLLCSASPAVWAQNSSTVQEQTATQQPADASLSASTLGPDDELTLGAPEIEELDKRVLRVQADGTVNVPLIGPLKAEGLTPQQFQVELVKALKTQFRDPQISFTSIDVKSKPISIIGAVNRPGIQQVDGERSLLEVLSMAGGLRNDAGYVVKVTRMSTSASTFPPEVRPTLTGDSVTAEISLSSLFEGKNPAENVTILPGDVITIPKGKMIYVVGNVVKSGGFIVGGNDDLTVLRALSMAEGLDSFADTAHARILRASATGQRAEQQLDIKKIMAGKAEDIRLNPDDILFIPSSTSKKMTAKSIEAAVQVGVGFAIWRR